MCRGFESLLRYQYFKTWLADGCMGWTFWTFARSLSLGNAERTAATTITNNAGHGSTCRPRIHLGRLSESGMHLLLSTGGIQ